MAHLTFTCHSPMDCLGTRKPSIDQASKSNCHSFRLCTGCGPTFVTTLLLQSHLGIGVYLYGSKFVRTLPRRKRLLHTCYLTAIFNFGSILLVAATKNYLPNSDMLRGIYAIVVSAGLISTGLDLLALAHSNISKETD